MDGISALLLAMLIVMLLVVFDVLAMRFGVDSREPIGDDHAR
ncbi:MAG TPA: hypothetical protein VFO73_09200 [Candidatus Limnocylindrales bacterium]|nr:hypothetical protein [Candidatus Limnocylindrales bacterium]